MSKPIVATAFTLGLLAVAWMASIFVGSDILALTITLVIAAVYLLGFYELRFFRHATSTLTSALNSATQPIEDLSQWLQQLHPSLCTSTQARIEGERAALPAPVLAPYLVGLLVMLGLLGTFVGMVSTLQGSVITLQQADDIQAMRAGLAAPISGLSLAFGTSVAGVAASAMLGLVLTLSRRERIQQTQRLDHLIATHFRSFSLVHNRQQTYKALQDQAQALPQVADTMHSMGERLALMSEQLSSTLVSNQENFQQSVEQRFQQLATKVEESLQKAIQHSGERTAEAVEPIMQRSAEKLGSQLNESTSKLHQQLQASNSEQAKTLSDQLQRNLQQWQQQLTDADAARLEQFTRQLQAANDTAQTQQHSNTTLFQQQLQQLGEQQEQQTTQLLQRITDLLGQTDKLIEARQASESEWLQQQQTNMTNLNESLHNSLSALRTEEQQRSEASITRLSELEASATAIFQQQLQRIGEQQEQHTEQLLQRFSDLLTQSDQLIESRKASESQWLQQQMESMTTLNSSLQNSLTALRDDEQQRSEAAIARLAQLEATVSQHLAQLGNELQEPMHQLIETASEAPKAAAEIITQLREEISNNIARDNELLAERETLMQQLNTLAEALEKSSGSYNTILEQLVDRSSDTLKHVATEFDNKVADETEKLASITAQFAASASEMASLSDAFGAAVTGFTESNSQVTDSLTQIEQALEQSSLRSDEQLGYYLVQAREIIDHSILSQKQMLEELRQLGQQEQLFAEAD